MHLKKFFVVGFRGMGFCSVIKYRLYVVEPETKFSCTNCNEIHPFWIVSSLHHLSYIRQSSIDYVSYCFHFKNQNLLIDTLWNFRQGVEPASLYNIWEGNVLINQINNLRMFTETVQNLLWNGNCSPTFSKRAFTKRSLPFEIRKSYIWNNMPMKKLIYLAYFKMWYLFQNYVFESSFPQSFLFE